MNLLENLITEMTIVESFNKILSDSEIIKKIDFFLKKHGNTLNPTKELILYDDRILNYNVENQEKLFTDIEKIFKKHGFVSLVTMGGAAGSEEIISGLDFRKNKLRIRQFSFSKQNLTKIDFFTISMLIRQSEKKGNKRIIDIEDIEDNLDLDFNKKEDIETIKQWFNRYNYKYLIKKDYIHIWKR